MDSADHYGYRMAASSGSLEDVYLQQECVYGLGPFSTYPSTINERDLQRLLYCVKFLPSPIFKMERLMPTNRAAQREYLPWPWDEEEPEPTSMMTTQQYEELKMENNMECNMAVKYREQEEEEESEEEDKERTEEESNEKEEEETSEESNSEEEEEEERMDDNEADEEKSIKEPVEEINGKIRSVQHQDGRRSRIRRNPIRHYINRNLRGKRNIIWTMLLTPMCE